MIPKLDQPGLPELKKNPPPTQWPGLGRASRLILPGALQSCYDLLAKRQESSRSSTPSETTVLLVIVALIPRFTRIHHRHAIVRSPR
jgi:hypothetical protein